MTVAQASGFWQLATAWPSLPEAVKRDILALVENAVRPLRVVSDRPGDDD